MQVLGVAPATTRTVDLAERGGMERETSFSLTRLWPEAPHAAVTGLRALLGEDAPDFSDGRVALLLCPIDQDVDCRALSARLVRGAARIEWIDVGWQVDYEDFVPEPDEYGPLLTFRFDRAQYETLLRTLLPEYEELVAHLSPRPTVAPPRRRWFRPVRGN